MTVELVKEMIKMRMNRIEEIMDESTDNVSARYAMGYEELEKLLVNIEVMESKHHKEESK